MQRRTPSLYTTISPKQFFFVQTTAENKLKEQSDKIYNLLKNRIKEESARPVSDVWGCLSARICRCNSRCLGADKALKLGVGWGFLGMVGGF